MARAVRAILFDLDDTIWAYRGILENAMLKMYQLIEETHPSIAARFTLEQLRALQRDVARENPGQAHSHTYCRKRALTLAAEACGVPPAAVVEPAFEAFMAARSDVSSALYPGALPLLSALKERGYVLGAVTNGNVCLDRTPSLSALFDFHLSAEDVGAAKPAPAVFQRSLDLAHAALARRVPGCAQLSPAEACFVGDDYTCDVFGSKRAGMLSVWLNHHGGPPPAISADPLAGSAAAAAAVGGALPPPQATEWHDAVISALPELETVLQRWGSPQQA